MQLPIRRENFMHITKGEQIFQKCHRKFESSLVYVAIDTYLRFESQFEFFEIENELKFTYVFPQTLHTFFDVSVLESGLEG